MATRRDSTANARLELRVGLGIVSDWLLSALHVRLLLSQVQDEKGQRKMSSYSSISQPTKPLEISSKKKRVLLIDTSRSKRDLRSETMRNLGVDVDCAADVSEARCWWKPNLYDLVVIHVEDAPVALKKFCDDLRTTTPPQKIMLLAGEPPDPASAPGEDSSTPSRDKKTSVNASNAKDSDSRRWGIQDACRRIAAIRSTCDARTKAIRNRPEPARDSETQRPNFRLDTELETLNREELQ